MSEDIHEQGFISTGVMYASRPVSAKCTDIHLSEDIHEQELFSTGVMYASKPVSDK